MTIRFTPHGAGLLAALALAATAPSAADAQAATQDTGNQPGSIRDAIGGKKQPGQTTPTPAPAPAPGEAGRGAPDPAGTGAATAGTPELPTKGTPIGERELASLGALRQSITLSTEMGQLGTKLGTAAEVKELAQRITRESEALQGELFQLLAYRGVQPASLPAPAEERSRHDQTVQRLSGLSGAQFDREYVLALREVQQTWVENLKRYRDETPGKDAQVKKWLDEAENTAENHLTATRQVKQALDGQKAAQR